MARVGILYVLSVLKNNAVSSRVHCKGFTFRHVVEIHTVLQTKAKIFNTAVEKETHGLSQS